MSYRIELNETMASGLRRVVGEQVELAIGWLTGDQPAHEAVHEARKCCKRIRAALRLARAALGDETYRAENRHYRDAARCLSTLRDREAVLETLDDVVPEAPLDAEAVAALRRTLESRRDAALERITQEGAFDRVVAMLRAGQARIADWPLPADRDAAAAGEGYRRLVPGLAKVYRRSAQRTADTETLHDWRKRAKYLYYQLKLIRPIAPRMLKAQQRELKALGDLLGDDHDLAVFAEMLIRDPHALPSADVAEGLLEHLADRRAAYQQRMWPVGGRVYAEKRRCFVGRIEAYCDTLETRLSLV